MQSRKFIRDTWVLGRRALREALRQPEGTIFGLIIPIFFLIVNVSQVSKTFPRSTPFLFGQTYAAFAIPTSMLFSGADGGAAGGMLQDILTGYYDKLRATPVSRSALVLGRLVATFVRAYVIGLAIALVSLLIGVRFKAGPLGVMLMLLFLALWSVIFNGFAQAMALKFRSWSVMSAIQLVSFPIIFLTPNFVPRPLLAHGMAVVAGYNPATYLVEAMRVLTLQGWQAAPILKAVGVLGALLVGVISLNVRMVNRSA